MLLANSNTQALNVIYKIGERLKDIDWVKQQIINPKNTNPKFFSSPKWDPLSISEGWPSLLLIFSSLDEVFPHENWDAFSHSCVLRIKEEIETNGIANGSLFSGLAGLCFSILMASKGKTRYQKLLQSLEDYLARKTEKDFLVPIYEKVESGVAFRMEEYDLIAGISGIGIYCLQNQESSSMASLLKVILETLISLTAGRVVEERSVPGWYMPVEYEFLEKTKQKYPRGSFNLGLAHGSTGILGFLTSAARKGIWVKGQLETIENLAKWIHSKRREKNGQLFWEDRVSLEEELGEKRETPEEIGADSWCYGRPGIIRTLYLASKFLKNSELTDFAEKAFLSIASQPEAHCSFLSPTFCHGLAGLSMIAHHMAQDTGSLKLKEWTFCLKKELLNYFYPENSFGFKDIERENHGETAYWDKIGILDGAGGVLLALLSLQTGWSRWDTPFLIQTYHP